MAIGDTPDIDLTTDTAALDGARSRRAALHVAAELVEDLIARPGSDPQWTLRVADALQGLRRAFDDHVTEVEADDGLLPQVRRDAPRLVNEVQRTVDEHVAITAEIDAAGALVHACEGDCGGSEVEAVRAAVTDLLRSISRHRQRGADLVYEAYSVDIGGGF